MHLKFSYFWELLLTFFVELSLFNLRWFHCSDLRRQLRIQLHLQFFASLLLSNVASVMWYMLVHYELLTNEDPASTVIARNQVRLSQWSFRRELRPRLRVSRLVENKSDATDTARDGCLRLPVIAYASQGQPRSSTCVQIESQYRISD